MNQELQDKIDMLKELAEKATPGPWEYGLSGFSILVTRYGRKVIASFPVEERDNARFITAANPQTILEIISELKSIQMHEHDMIQWAELEIEDTNKTLAWMNELQGILGLEQEISKDSRAEITQKVQELVRQKELKNEKSD